MKYPRRQKHEKQLSKTDMHDYQNTGKKHIIETSYCGLLLDMGLGKTVTTLTAVEELIFNNLEVSTVLVIAPKRVVESVWTAEIKKWKHLRYLEASRVIGTAAQRKAALKKKAHIYLISRDNIAWLIGQYGGSMLPFDMLVIDESSSFKSHKSMRFKALRKVQPCFKRVVILTGTPAPNGLIDLWSQIYLLDRGERLGKFIGQYREKFFRPDQRKGDIIYNYKIESGSKEKEIYKLISDICMSMKAEDYLDVPKRVNNFINISLTAAVKKRYIAFEKEKVLELIDDTEGDVSAVNAAALSNKLLQFANGAVYDADKEAHVVHNAKLEALKDILEDANGKPVLLAWTYRTDMHRIKKAFRKYAPRELNKDSERTIEEWNAGKIKLLMMHPASGGHGLNLQAGGHIIVWFGMTWSLELYQQFNARLHRQGQKHVTVINHLVAASTIDEDVIAAIERKDMKQEGLLQAIKSRITKYEKELSEFI